MKKALAWAFCLVATAAVADVEISLGSVGVTAVTTSQTNTIVCCSYLDLANGGEMSVSNLVKTANLTVGDKLYTYDNGNYACWELKTGSSGALYWEKPAQVFKMDKGGQSSINGVDASIVTTAVGKGIWLVRGSGWNGNEFTFYLYGTPKTDLGAITVSKNATTLTGNPTQTAKAPTIANAAAGDLIFIPKDGKWNIYSYQSKDGTWSYDDGSWVNPVKFVSAPTIPAGMGFWYKSTNTVNDITFTW